jgi:hypothetical protein
MPVASGEALWGSFALIGNGWNLFKTRLLSMLGVQVLPFIIAAVVSIGSLFILKPGFFTLGIILIIILPGILFCVLYAIASFALMYAVRGTDAGGNISILESYKQSFQHILSYVWIGILEVFVLIGRLALWVGVPSLVIGAALWFGGSTTAVLKTVILPVFLFFAGIVAFVLMVQSTVWFYFSQWELMQNNRKGLEAIAASREYVKGYFGAIVWRVFVIGIALGIGEIIVTLLAYLLSFSSTTIHNLLDLLFSAFFFTPLILCITYCLYENIRAVNPIPAADFSAFKKALMVYAVAGVVTVFILLGLSALFAKNIETLIPTNVERNNGMDASLKSDLTFFVDQSGIDYSEAGTYGTAPFTITDASSHPFTGTGTAGLSGVTLFGIGASGDAQIANVFSSVTNPTPLYYASNGKAFFIAVQLSSGYYCVDSTGSEKTVTQTPTASGDGSTYSCSQP